MDILLEFDIKPGDTHYRDRMMQRFFGQKFFEVYALNKNYQYDTQEPRILGKFPIPQEAINNVTEIINKLEQPYYTFEKGTVLIAQLYIFNLKPNDIILTGSPKEQETNKKLLQDKKNIYWFIQEHPLGDEFSTRQNISRGNVLLCYIVDGVLTTIFLSQVISKDHIIHKTKNRHPNKEIIYMDDPLSQIDAYIDIDKAKEYPNPPEDVKTPETPEEPQLSDDEKRKLAYKERMKKEFERQKKLWKRR